METPAASGDATGEASIFPAAGQPPHVDAAASVQSKALNEDNVVDRRDKRPFHGSWSADDEGRPRWDQKTELKAKFDYHHEDGRYSCTKLKGVKSDGDKVFLTGRHATGGMGKLQFEKKANPGDFYRLPGLEYYLKGKGDEPELLYRLPDLKRATAERPDDPVYITEGEKDTDSLQDLGLIATTNPDGAMKWQQHFNSHLAGRDIVVFADNDERGREHAAAVARSVSAVAKSVKVVELPGLPRNGDVTDWLSGGRSCEDLLKVVADTPAVGSQAGGGFGVSLDDFRAFMPSHSYIFMPSGEMWPATSVNSRIPPVPMTDRNGRPVLDEDEESRWQAANKWLDENRAVEQMTWAPGEPQVIANRLISEGGYFERPGCAIFNLYRPPVRQRGDASMAGPWIAHVRRVYPGDADHIIDWLAHRVQRPQEKINHAIVMGGAQGIGKDTILEPVKAAIGPWNFAEVSPAQMMGRFNGFVKSVILRVSEARDLGDTDRFAFYDHTKTYTAAPPDVLRVDEKFMREYSVFNVCGVVITSNHKTNGLYLPEDDRRHYVAWSDLTKADFDPAYYPTLWDWYSAGGTGHVAAYLCEKDISGFNPKAPPRKTEAFWEIVQSNSAPEDAELSDALEKLGNPEAVTLLSIAHVADASFAEWLRDRKNSRRVPHKMEECGYKPVRNPGSKSGRWKVGGKDMAIYALKVLSDRDAVIAAEKRASEGYNANF